MIYEGTIQFTEQLDNGNEHVTKQPFLVDNCNTFADAEDLLFVGNDGLRDLDVIALKRSKLNEIVNRRSTQDDKVFVAEVMDVRTDDDGIEHELIYRVALFATNINQAHEIMDNYLAQCMDMQLVSLKRTKVKDVLNY